MVFYHFYFRLGFLGFFFFFFLSFNLIPTISCLHLCKALAQEVFVERGQRESWIYPAFSVPAGFSLCSVSVGSVRAGHGLGTGAAALSLSLLGKAIPFPFLPCWLWPPWRGNPAHVELSPLVTEHSQLIKSFLESSLWSLFRFQSVPVSFIFIYADTVITFYSLSL